MLYWRPNEAGGRTYYSDEVGGGVEVWDTCLVDMATLIAVINQENQIRFTEERKRNDTK